jgi:hypothetical protein
MLTLETFDRDLVSFYQLPDKFRTPFFVKATYLDSLNFEYLKRKEWKTVKVQKQFVFFSLK